MNCPACGSTELDTSMAVPTLIGCRACRRPFYSFEVAWMVAEIQRLETANATLTEACRKVVGAYRCDYFTPGRNPDSELFDAILGLEVLGIRAPAADEGGQP